MKNLKPEMIEKARTAKSAEELLELAKANNVEMTADEAKTYFAQLNPKSGELNDDDLDAVAGGGCNDDERQRENEDKVIHTIVCPSAARSVIGASTTLVRVDTYGNAMFARSEACLKRATTIL